MAPKIERVQALFLMAVEIEDEESRADLLDQECASEPDLRQRVEALLRGHQNPAPVLEHPPVGRRPEGDSSREPDSAAREAELRARVRALLRSDEPSPPSDGHSVDSPSVPPGAKTLNLKPGCAEPAGEGDGSDVEEMVRRLGRLMAPAGGGKPAKDLLLGGRYRLGAEIARGGMGLVFRATDELFSREVAVKFLLVSRPEEAPYLVERFGYEARVTARLQHPGVPPVHDLGTVRDGRPFLVMKLIQGRTLAELLDARLCPTDELPRWIHVFEQVAQTVGYAHSRHVLHRDLKPSNVMVGPFGEVQVMDWGLAKELGGDDQGRPLPSEVEPLPEGMTRTGTVMGTLEYMAPEQARGEVERLDARTDVFALGAILCEILTGSAPYDGKRSSEETRLRAATADLEDIYEKLRSCGADEELVALAVRCLSAEPMLRPSDGAAVARLVAEYRETVEQRLREAETERARSEIRQAEQRKRRRVQALLAGTLVLLVAATGAFAWWRGQVQHRARLTEARHETELAREEAARTLVEADIRARQTRNREATLGLLRQLRTALQAKNAGRAEALVPLVRNRLHEGNVADLEKEFAFYAGELTMLRDLDRIDSNRWTLIDGHLPSPKKSVESWEAAFRSYGIVPGETPPEAAAARINGSLIRERLLGSMESWFLTTGRPRALGRLLSEADPDAFRNEARATSYAEALAARKEPAPEQPGWFAAAHGSDPDLDTATRKQLLTGAYHRSPQDLKVLTALSILGDTYNSKEAPERVAWCRAALVADPNCASSWNNLGVSLRMSNDLSGALAAFDRTLSLAPDLAAAHNNRGSVLGALGRDAEAIAEHREAIRLAPNLKTARVNLCITQLGMGDLQGCEESLKDTLERYPNDYKALQTLGTLRCQQGRWDEALTALNQAIEANPASWEGHCMLGVALFGKDRLEEALSHYQEAARLKPDYFEAHFNIGVTLHNMGDPSGAVFAYRRAIEINPADPKTYKYITSILFQCGEVEDLNRTLRGALKYHPNNQEMLLHYGTTCFQLGRFPEAETAFRKILEVGRETGKVQALLGMTLRMQKDFDGARKAFRRAAELNPRQFGHLERSTARER